MPGVLDTHGAVAPSRNGNGYANGAHAGASDGHASNHADAQHSLQNGHLLHAWWEEPIAVIGMACMLPGEVGRGNVDVEGLWNMLLEQKSGVKAYPGRFNRDLHVGTSVGKALSDKGGFLTDTDLFDPLEFGIGPSEASRMSGTARMMLEMAFSALHDSGIDYRGSRTACFGIASGSPLAMQGEEHEINEHTAQGQAYSLLSNRVSFLLDLRGPTMTVDSACSTGLTALHLASESIRRGEVDTAVVVGANLTMDWTSTVAFSQSGVLSPDGICRSLDDKASGYVRSEACGAIVLRRADVARKAGDRIHANILATAIGSNGRNQSQAAPSGPAQMRIIDETYAKIGRKPSEVDYVELHATGTKVGDPIEANAAGKTYSQGRQGRELVVGTLKANTGHTEWVSGIMSLIKVCHMLRTGIVPPQPNLQTPSRAIDWASWNMRAPTSAEPLGKGGKEKSIISIQSYGFGGATGHAIIEAVAGQQAAASTSNQASFSLCFAGGLTPRSASAVSSEAATQLQSHSLDVAALARQTRSMPCRSFALVESETGRLVTAFSKPRNLAPTTFATEPKLLFILSGQGPQHFHMGRSLYRDFAAFRESIQASDRVYARVTGKSLLQETQLFQWSPSAKSETLEGSALWPASVVFPSICMVQIALFDLLKSFGVVPNAIVGHSAGETAALYVSGAAPRDVAMEVAIARGQIFGQYKGKMAAVHATRKQLDELLLQAAQRGAHVDVAAYNADGAFSISGSAERVDAVVKSAQDSGIFARALRTESPMHSAAISAAKDVFIQTIDDIWARYDAQITSPQLPLFSTVTGKRVDRRQDAQYLWSNSREAVQFVAAIRSAQAFLGGESEAADSYTTIELSPHPVLSAYLGELGVEHIVPVMERRNKAPATCPADTEAFVKAVGTLFVSGHKTVQYHSLLYADPAERKDQKSVIAFPWKKTHWPGDVRPGWSSLADHPPLYAPDAAEFKISCATHPELAEHKVNGARIIPGAAFLETGLELDSSINVISGGELLGAMPIVEARERPIEVKVQRDGATYLITSRSGGSLNGPSKPHFKGNAYAVDPQTLSRPPRKNLAQILSRFEKHIDQETFYTLVAGTAEFNGAFRRINKWSGKDGESLAYLDGLRPSERQAYRVHPCVIDAALHSCAADFAKFLSHNGAETVETILPRAFDRVTVYDANLARPTLISHVRRTKYAPHHLTYDMDICDEEGEVLITFESVHCRKYTTQPVEPITKRYDMEWQPADLLPLDLAPPASVAPPPSREELFEALDQLCIESLARHMPSQPPSADASIDRKRYYAMAQRALARPERSTHFQPSPGTSEEWTVYTEMIRRLDSVLADVFASNTASLPVLFAHNDDLMSRAYKAMALHDRTYELFASVFGDFLKQCAAQGKHVVRVLEVGAGTGQLTRYLNSVVQQLATYGTSEKPAVEFVITDVNVQLAAEAASTLTQDSGVTPAAFNLFTGQSGLTKASDRHSFDFICMSNVLHIAANLPTAMVNLQKYMAPGAMVGVVEMDGRVNETQAPGALFIDYIFGSFKDWFGMEDHREHPTQSAGAWHSFFSQHMDRVALVEPAHEPTLSRNLALFYQDSGEVRKLMTKEIQQLTPPTEMLRHVFYYDESEVAKLQKDVEAWDLANQRVHVTIAAADEGVGQSILGLTRSLRSEYLTWRFTTVLFDPALTAEQRTVILESPDVWAGSELELRFDANGRPQVHRMVTIDLDPVAEHTPTTWQLDPRAPSELLPVTLASLSTSEATVNVIATAPLTDIGCVYAFAGVVTSEGKTFDKGTHVAGIWAGNLSNVINVRIASVAVLPSTIPLERAPAVVVAAFSVGLALQYAMVEDGQAASVSDDAAVSAIANGLLLAKGWAVPEGQHDKLDLLIRLTSTDHRSNPLHLEDGVGVELDCNIADASVAQQGQHRIGRFVSVNVPLLVSRSPVRIGRVLSEWLPLALSTAVGETLSLDSISTRLIADVEKNAQTMRHFAFDPLATYVLLGGCGGLGAGFASEMYNLGARHIVLTSRTGPARFERGDMEREAALIRYLQSVPDLHLELVACDAMDEGATRALFGRLTNVRGIIWMPLSWQGGHFTKVPDALYRNMRESKYLGLEVLTRIVDPKQLDWLVACSSVASWNGAAAQSAYAAACTAMEGIVCRIPNAVSIAIPIVLGAGQFARWTQSVIDAQGGKIPGWLIQAAAKTGISFTMQSVLHQIIDSINVRKQRKVNLYIPHVDTRLVTDMLGPNNAFARHLDLRTASEKATLPGANGALDQSSNPVDRVISQALCIPSSDIDDDTPLSSYGLDSLSAVRLSSMLRTVGVTMTQMQLLGNATPNKIKALAVTSSPAPQ
ncbi:ketoacyl-synt-domain-containing protein [Ceraceosorus guamensis]|uniref:Ketoacyl-synt-domain-containing protein n=1 Tax=Ceraceosorus guamensis TaxID=1522189 RepID=A0A316VRY7_9BASI|nr:ketoacyl-synt-domain-containing protein [Ceraceosorus guamensis]PWN40272.1 ketoacyl-synt-domain-containing protein [Ceraceosorus guamensis]